MAKQVQKSDPYGKVAHKRIVNQSKSLDSGRAVVIKQFDSSKGKDGSISPKAVAKFKKSTDSLNKVQNKIFAKPAKKNLMVVKTFKKK